MFELSTQLSQIAQPFFMALAFVFVIISWSVYSTLKTEKNFWQSSLLASLGGIFSATGCVFLASIAFGGRSSLVVVTLCNFATFIVFALLLHSWCQPLTKNVIYKIGGIFFGFVILMVLAFQLNNNIYRIIFQIVFYVSLIGWISRSLRFLSLHRGWSQLGTTKILVLMMNVLILAWVYVNVMMKDVDVVTLGPDVVEPYMSFVCRFFWIALMVALQFNINALALEQSVIQGSTTRIEKQKVQELNEQLSLTLKEKNETLRLLSLAARHYNFPLVMSSLAHELNQPLFAIHLYADHMASDWDVMSDEDRAEVAEGLVDCSLAAADVVADYRKMFEQFREEKKQIDLAVMCQLVTRSIGSELQRKNIILSMTLKPDVQWVGDPLQLETALIHALRFFTNRYETDQQAPTLKLELKRIPGFVQVLISGNLPPMDSSALKDAFKRAISMEQDAIMPSSMWLCRSIWEHMGGAVELKSLPDGVTLYLNLPWTEAI